MGAESAVEEWGLGKKEYLTETEPEVHAQIKAENKQVEISGGNLVGASGGCRKQIETHRNSDRGAPRYQGRDKVPKAKNKRSLERVTGSLEETRIGRVPSKDLQCQITSLPVSRSACIPFTLCFLTLLCAATASRGPFSPAANKSATTEFQT